MRNPDRLDKFYAEKCRLHKKYLPDWRVGQLDSNFYGWLAQNKERDLFYPEEDEMIKRFKEFIKDMVGERYNETN